MFRDYECDSRDIKHMQERDTDLYFIASKSALSVILAEKQAWKPNLTVRDWKGWKGKQKRAQDLNYSFSRASTPRERMKSDSQPGYLRVTHEEGWMISAFVRQDRPRDSMCC